MKRLTFSASLVSLVAVRAAAQVVAPVAPTDSVRCPSCREWNAPMPPVKVFGNVHYVGTRGLSSILITSPSGHVLIDGGLPESAPLIAANIRSLGFALADVKVILNSHAHFDHAGGIGILQQASGARVAARRAAIAVLGKGESTADDPQIGLGVPFRPATNVEVVEDGRSIRVGDIEVVAHPGGGHMPGGTTWTWRSCEAEASKCLDFVYGDSQTPISNDTYLYTRNPEALAEFERGFAALESVSCDILLTPHPSASSMIQRLGGTRERLVDREACRAYAARGRAALTARLAREKAGGLR